MIAKTYSESGARSGAFVRGQFHAIISRAAELGLTCYEPELTAEDMRISGVRGTCKILDCKILQGHIDQTSAQTIRESLPLFACMTNAEIKACGLQSSVIPHPV